MLHNGSIAEMKTGEGKNLSFHINGISQCPNRRGGSWYVMNPFIYIREAKEKSSVLISTAVV